jgi:thiamine monophosphate kinase
LYVLGGDTNISSRLEMGGAAVGIVTGPPPLTRLGCRPGDYVLGSGPFGGGSGFAFVQLVLRRRGRRLTSPTSPRTREGVMLRHFASCCMTRGRPAGDAGSVDAPELRIRDRLRGAPPDRPATLGLSNSAGIPAWIAVAAHLAFELVFTVPTERQAPPTQASAVGWEPRLIGRVGRPGISLALDGRAFHVDMGLIRNLFVESGDDIDAYFKGLLQIDSALGKGDTP